MGASFLPYEAEALKEKARLDGLLADLMTISAAWFAWPPDKLNAGHPERLRRAADLVQRAMEEIGVAAVTINIHPIKAPKSQNLD